MPNIELRVNSLTKEREENGLNVENNNENHSLFTHFANLSALQSSLSVAVIGRLTVHVTAVLLSRLQQTAVNSPLYIKVFLPIDDSIDNLLPLLPTNTHDAVNGIRGVSGCHRFIAAKLAVDIYLGDTPSQLNSMVKSAKHKIDHWHLSDPTIIDTDALVWTLASLSADHCQISLSELTTTEGISPSFDLLKTLQQSGFTVSRFNPNSTTAQNPSEFGSDSPTKLCLISTPKLDSVSADIITQERQALRRQQADDLQSLPLHSARGDIAIIGGGIAAGTLCLSLAQRQRKLHLFCMEDALGQQASGNKQGAIYPLLTPDNGTLSQFFQQGLLFSVRQISRLTEQGFNIDHQFCGVLQTGHDERSRQRLNKIIQGQSWPENMAKAVDAQQANDIARVAVNQPGIYYPQAGWVSPRQYAQAAFDYAQQLTEINSHFNCHIVSISQQSQGWILQQKHADGRIETHGPFAALVLANGRHLTDFEQTKQLAVSGFRGQVSHVPSTGELSKLQTVLCSHGYLTPAHNDAHCTGASYIKDPQDLDFSAVEQQQNLEKLQQSYPDSNWVNDVDVSANSARVGVRMVTRDHAPMMGCAPNYTVMLQAYAKHQHTKANINYWRTTPAPVHENLFVLGGLGSRGLTSGPLAAELLAAQLCGEQLPADIATLKMLNPNRMWMRKLLKGKALDKTLESGA